MAGDERRCGVRKVSKFSFLILRAKLFPAFPGALGSTWNAFHTWPERLDRQARVAKKVCLKPLRAEFSSKISRRLPAARKVEFDIARISIRCFSRPWHRCFQNPFEQNTFVGNVLATIQRPSWLPPG